MAATLDLTAGPGLWLTASPADLLAEVPVGDRLVAMPLGRVGCGILPAVDGAALTPGLRLTARLAEGTAELVDFDGAEAAAALTPEAADRWAAAFGRALAGLVAAGPRIDAALAPGETRAVDAPATLGSRRGVCWLVSDEPCLAGFGVAPAQTVLAATPEAWAQATGRGTVRAAAARFLWATGALPGALAATQGAWISALPALAALAEVDRHQGERSRAVRARALLAAAERRVTGTSLPAAIHGPEEPALAVAAELAHRLGLPLQVPPKRLRRTADQPYGLHEVASASGFRLRRVAPGERVRPSPAAPLVAGPAEAPRLVMRPRDLPAGGTPLLVPIRPLRSARITARSLLRLPQDGTSLRSALLDRLMRLPAERLRQHEAGRWVRWLGRLEAEAHGLSADLRQCLWTAPAAVGAVAALAVLAGWTAVPVAAGLAALHGLGRMPGAARRDAGRADDDPRTLAVLERLPKIRSMAARDWVLLSWYQSRPGERPPATALGSALRAAALGAAPLAGAALGAGLVGAVAMGVATLAGGVGVAAGLRLARTVRRGEVPGVPAGLFDLDGEGSPPRSDPGELGGGIAAVGLSVRRPDEERWLFADLTLTVAPGEFVALAGPAGCGKTTLLSILLGRRSAGAGAVFYDGYDLRSLDPAVLTRHVAAVGQRDRLPSGTLREMLTDGRELGEDRLWDTLAALGMDGVVRTLPAGLDTRLARGHAALSQGQAQRLLLVRALLRPASVLVLDEPTAALDGVAEGLAIRALRRTAATRIVATHRPALIRAADRVIDLGSLAG